MVLPRPLVALVALAGAAAGAAQLRVQAVAGSFTPGPVEYSTAHDIPLDLPGGPVMVPQFQPVGTLSAVRMDQWTTLHHPVFPRHSVRIKQSDFCDTTVRAYTGYIDIDAKHLFFYFFESRSDPDKDDVIFWTNGGPGCSSSLGLFMELGPCRVTNATEDPSFFKHAWNTNANVFFIDQPVGVGFSYAEHGISVSHTNQAAQDIAAFVAIFFEHFTSFKGRAFHMAGESYGGRYIPLFASAVYDQNAFLVKQGLTPINLTSAIIGNGMTDVYSMTESYYDMTCTNASVPPVLDISTCVRMKKTIPRCRQWLQSSCEARYDEMACNAAISYCQGELEGPYSTTGLNPYDISRQCEDRASLCYPVTNQISAFLDRADVRTTLGVDPTAAPTHFSSCSNTVGYAFNAAGDILEVSTYHVAALLERGVHVLIYAGTFDWICNWVGNEAWTRALEWNGQAAFAGQALREWAVDGKRVGLTRSAGGFTFASVEGAGHMVPYDKPVEALAMINRWLAREEL